MQIGIHVSTAGGLDKAVERGVKSRSDAIQVFNQSPRMWRPTNYTDDDFATYREAVSATRIESTTIHAVYLINCASKEREIRKKSIASLTHALRVGDGIGAHGVVLHAGARKGEPHRASMKRAAKAIAAALADSDECPVLLENTAGTQGPLGRNFDELAELVELLDGDGPGRHLPRLVPPARLGVRDPHPRTRSTEVVDEFDAEGRARAAAAACTSTTRRRRSGATATVTPTWARARSARRGLAVFLSEPRFEDLPTLIETGGTDGSPGRADVELARKLRQRGNAARRRGGRRSKN